MHYLLFYSAALLLILSIVDLPLALANVRRKAYFYFNSTLQLAASIFLFFLGVGFVLLIFNILIIVSLRGDAAKSEPPGEDTA